MRKKLLGIVLAVIMVVPCFTSVFAVSFETILDRLNDISLDIVSMKAEYENIITNYSDVIDSLSEENKDVVMNLASNLLAEDIRETVNSIKSELQSMGSTEATEVLNAINDLENEAKTLINNNKDIVNELKENYQDLTLDETKQIVEKVKEITTSLGANVDTSKTYDAMTDIVSEAHTMLLGINNKFENLIANNIDAFKEVASISLMKDMFYAVKSMDLGKVMTVFVKAVNNTSNSAELKEELKVLRDDLLAVKDKLMEVKSLDEQEILMMTDEQVQQIASKVKVIEQDYIAFAKVLINEYVEDYMTVVIDLTYDVDVDKMVQKANRAVDYVLEYKDTLRDLLNGKVDLSKLPLPEEELKAVGLLVSLGFIDTSDFNKDFILNTFEDEIDQLMNYAAKEVLDYVHHIDATLKEEVTNELNSTNSADVMQSNMRVKTAQRFTTMANIDALKNRVKNDVIPGHQGLKQKLDKAAEYVYKVYNTNIMTTIRTAVELEKNKSDKSYEYDDNTGVIITNKFLTTNEFNSSMGVDVSNPITINYAELESGAVKTGSNLKLTLSSKANQEYTFVVLGDVYADGIVDARDYMAIKNQIMEKDELNDTSSLAADTYRDGVIDARDYMMIKNQIMEKDTISL